jgi:xanthine dehydrogenase accessory factor
MNSSLALFLAGNPNAILVEITGTLGSTPREAGAVMLVSADRSWGTIGGGQLEFMAIANARKLLAGAGGEEVMDIPLGPDIGQCCGGRTRLRCRQATAEAIAKLKGRLERDRGNRPSVYIFGAGHVGRALAAALAPLPLATTIVEVRREELDELPPDIDTMLVAMPEALVADMPAGAAVVILTHDHALDFMIAREALARGDLAYVGMIGSATKRATFSHWLVREGSATDLIDGLTLPIGGSRVKDKRPEVIAAMTAAELLTAIADYRGTSSS